MSAKAKPGGCPPGYKQTEAGVEYGLARDVQHLLGTGTQCPIFLWFIAKNKPDGKRCQLFNLDLAV
jgi:hypothetical protein